MGTDVVSENFRLEVHQLRGRGRLLALVVDPRDDADQTLRRAAVAVRAVAMPDDLASLWLDVDVHRLDHAVETLEILWQEIPELFRLVEWRLPADLELTSPAVADAFGNPAGLDAWSSWRIAHRKSHAVRHSNPADVDRLVLERMRVGSGRAMALFRSLAEAASRRALAKADDDDVVVVADLGDALGRRVVRESGGRRLRVTRTARRAVATCVITAGEAGIVFPRVGFRGQIDPKTARPRVVFVAGGTWG